jgi:hypothetical protein
MLAQRPAIGLRLPERHRAVHQGILSRMSSASGSTDTNWPMRWLV